MEETISIQEMLQILKKRIAMILVLMVVGGAVAAVSTMLFITPKYGASASLVVQSGSEADGMQTNEINSNILMINTYKDLIKSNLVLDTVSKELQEEKGISYSIGQLKSTITVNQSQNSQMFSIDVQTDNAEKAAVVANTTAEVFKDTAGQVLKVDKVTVVSPAVVNEGKVSPNDKLNLAIGLAIGAMLGVGLAFLFEFMDKTVKDERFVTETLGLPILGEISHISARDLQTSVGQVTVQVKHQEQPKQDDTESTDMSDLMARRMMRRERV
jgi:capsular polysaccharide biosynthesis protein